jgi:hypothetical protein
MVGGAGVATYVDYVHKGSELGQYGGSIDRYYPEENAPCPTIISAQVHNVGTPI